MRLSDAVRQRMEEKGWTADELAERAKMARSTVFSLLAGADNTRMGTLRKLKRVGVDHPLTKAV